MEDKDHFCGTTRIRQFFFISSLHSLFRWAESISSNSTIKLRSKKKYWFFLFPFSILHLVNVCTCTHVHQLKKNTQSHKLKIFLEKSIVYTQAYHNNKFVMNRSWIYFDFIVRDERICSKLKKSYACCHLCPVIIDTFWLCNTFKLFTKFQVYEWHHKHSSNRWII